MVTFLSEQNYTLTHEGRVPALQGSVQSWREKFFSELNYTLTHEGRNSASPSGV